MASGSGSKALAGKGESPLSIEEKYDEVRQLISIGKEKGYLLYDEVNELLPADITSSDELDDLFSTFGSAGIEVVDSEQKYREDKLLDRTGEGAEELELDLTPGALDKTNDPVRMYLREMGTVPLLTREGEVEIAKRIERGQLRVLKALSRSPIVIREIIAMGEDLKRGVRSIKEVVIFDEDEITEEVLANRLKDATGKIDELSKHYKKSEQLVEKLADIVQKKNPRLHRKTRWALGREQVEISRAIRKIPFTNTERKRLIDRVNKTVDSMRG